MLRLDLWKGASAHSQEWSLVNDKTRANEHHRKDDIMGVILFFSGLIISGKLVFSNFCTEVSACNKTLIFVISIACKEERSLTLIGIWKLRIQANEVSLYSCLGMLKGQYLQKKAIFILITWLMVTISKLF